MLENIGETKQKYYMKEVAAGVYFFDLRYNINRRRCAYVW
jgi:hypothetical protein